MNLVIDKGNSLTKIALFDKNSLIEKKVFDDLKLEHIKDILKYNPNVDAAILSSENEYSASIKKYMEDNFHFIEMNEHTQLPVKNKYNTPKTLGKDRLAAVIGGKLYYSDKNLLVINAGTCITYNFITSDNEFLGGAISPGIKIRFKSLNLFAPKLPLQELDNKFDKLIGQSTSESILSGILNGIIFEINGAVERYKAEYPKFKALLSGGDYIYFENKVSKNIFSVPDIVLTGLNVILDYNISKKNIL
jgi:type III pantothenate kinase